jgi:hypothetical protein
MGGWGVEFSPSEGPDNYREGGKSNYLSFKYYGFNQVAAKSIRHKFI